ncbi:hypothetical protein AB0F73_25085, partial [Micromonospora purpureochromogenes]
YRAAAGDNPGRALDNPAFADLVTKAGGRDEVAGYCERVVRDTGAPASPSAPPSAVHPTPTERSTGRPSHAPSTAGGKPDAPARTVPSRPTG